MDTFRQLVDRGDMIAMLSGNIITNLMKESPREIVRRAYQVQLHYPMFLRFFF